VLDDPDLFTGLFWSGTRGRELGLVDALGDMRAFLKARYGEKTVLKLIQPSRGLLGRRLALFGTNAPDLSDIAASAAGGIVDAATERALWARYGL